MAIIDTPTSAKTAIHIVAYPNKARAKTLNFISNEKIMLDFTILIVFLLIIIPSLIFLKSSFIITISAASMAASEPTPPIAIPTSDIDNTGASFIPSPTKATFLFSS